MPRTKALNFLLARMLRLTMTRNKLAVYSLLLLLFVLPLSVTAQIDTNKLGEMHWRSIGPFRGGRTRAAAGVATLFNNRVD